MINRMPRSWAFKPNQIAGLTLWLDASDSDTITLNGSNVSTWADKSGLGNDASMTVEANQPEYKINAQNGLNSVLFDGVDDSLDGSNLGLHLSSQTIFVVSSSEPASAINQEIVIFALMPAYETGMVIERSTWASGSVGIYNSGSSVSATNIDWQGYTKSIPYNVISYRKDVGVDRNMWLNGTDNSNNLVATTYSSGNYVISPSITYSFPWKGEISEIIIYNTALSTRNIRLNESYLFKKWGI